MKKVGVLVVHGMGSQTPDFAEPMINEVTEKLAKKGKNPKDIAWQPVFWSDILEQNELRYLREVAPYDLDFIGLRKFIVKALGDAVAYQKTNNPENQMYDRVNSRMSEAMNALHITLGKKDLPLVVMAHSLGCFVLSCYIWDSQKGGKKGFLGFETMKRILTFGSNLPLFSFAYSDPKAIKKPDGCIWHNYYDKDDVLGYPLRPISQSYTDAVDKDIQMNVGSLVTSWNPASHNGYWTDKDFVGKVAGHLAELI